MAETLIDRAWAWLHATFPERQVYIRSEGRVQFFTFGSALQATCAGLALIFLGWVSFASVNVIFKDRIIAARDHRFQQMQSTYENRVADLQLSYDELNDSLVSAEDRFKSTADEVEAKQKSVAKLVGEKQIVDAALTGSNRTGSVWQSSAIELPRTVPTGGNMASDSLESDSDSAPPAGNVPVAPPRTRSGSFSGSGSSELTIMPDPVEPQPRTAKPAQASLLGNSLDLLTQKLFPAVADRTDSRPTRVPVLQQLALQTDRLKRLDSAEMGIVTTFDRSISGRVSGVEGLLERVGLSPASLSRERVGGPLVSISSFQLDGISDQGFTSAYASALAHASELTSLVSAVRHVPLTTPVHGAQFELTSGFGPRVDPFTSRIAFHPGLDFAGPWGSTVAATAPGVVVWSGPRAGYGNMVEIDHGLGFHTRYGHLSSILVRAGARVQGGSPIGRLGSTGRSTGPHVHYEVWFANTVKDPSRYIAAGRRTLN